MSERLYWGLMASVVGGSLLEAAWQLGWLSLGWVPIGWIL
jgi:hypothetical protein